MASAVLFDIGVFALVVGATILMLIALAHQSVRGHRAAAPRALQSPEPLQSPQPLPTSTVDVTGSTVDATGEP
jgi:multicomponent K+:H+ antiporter subunit A